MSPRRACVCLGKGVLDIAVLSGAFSLAFLLRFE